MEVTEAEFQHARSIHALATITHEDYVTASNLRDENVADACAERLRGLVPRGLYEHWKSVEGDLKYYVVCDVLLEVDVHYPSVSYKSLYGKRAGLPVSRHLIHKESPESDIYEDKDRGFLTPINRPMYRGPRFRLVHALSQKEIATLLDYVPMLKGFKDPVEFRSEIGTLLKKKIPLF